MTVSKEEVVARLGSAIRQAQLTQREVAERSELEDYTLNKILKGTRGLSALELARIAAVLQIPVEEFLYEEDEA